jgi:2-amino-4-hydroxy-6-hydroxymethyldihydropteridine diphosphokinase
MEAEVFLGLGSNLGNREDNLRRALERIGSVTGEIAAVSKIYETEPWGFESSARFLNMVAKVICRQVPEELLETLQGIETELGRVRGSERYSSRTIDIDILLYGNMVIDQPQLVVPHPLIQERRFVLVPLCDLIPGEMHPVLNRTFSELLEECRDKSEVRNFITPIPIAIGTRRRHGEH